MFISLILLILLIIINGIFAASELSFLSIDKFKLNKDAKNGNKRAIKVKRMLDNPDQFLSTIQIAITLAGFLASAFAADTFADYLLPFFSFSIVSKEILRLFLVILITIILSYFTLVFGELVPKRIAINYPQEISYFFVDIIRLVMFFCYPFIKILTFSTEVVCKFFKIKSKDNKYTEEDVKKMILLGYDEGILEEKEKEYILNIFKFNDIEVSNIITPKKDVVLINIEDTILDIISVIKSRKYTRYPVYSKNKKKIIGILNVKDLIMQYKKDNRNLDIKKIIRPVSSFLSTDKIDDVFRLMQEKREVFALVYDKEKFLGIVTIEDAIEEIVGNIYDEYDG